MCSSDLVGPIEEVFVKPEHPYTQGLLNAFPSLVEDESELITITGEPPDLSDSPGCCRFAPRCPYREARCTERSPSLTERDDGRARCFVTEDGTDLQETYDHVLTEEDEWQRL